MKKNIFLNRLVTFAIATIMSLSAITLISVTVKAEPTVDGVITPGEYSSGLHIVLEGPWDSPSSPYDGPLDGYLYWDTQYLWIAVDEPVPEWGGGASFIEFMWDAGIHGTLPYYHAWVLFSNGLWQYVRCSKPTGSWGWAADPFPGHSSYAVGTATEFKFDYTDYGTLPGDTIKLIVDSSDRSASSLTFGNCQIWPYVSPSNPDYYPSETPSSVATWGTIVLGDNQPPTADAGGPYNGLSSENILLDGSGSNDLDGTITSYEWDLDHDGVYDDATGSTTTKNWPLDGTYTISLKVTDNDGFFDTDSTIVNIGSHVVDGVISPDEYDGGMAVALVAGTWTVDAYIDWDCQHLYVAVDEPVLSYIEFAFDAGAARNRFDLFCLFKSGASNYQYCLKSGGGWSGPTTSPSAYQAFSNTATEFKFDYTAFGIVPGDTIPMCIERGGTPNAYWPDGGKIWTATGRRPDPLTWGDVTISGDCSPPNIPPIADANGPYLAYSGESIQLDGSGSSDSDGTIVSYEWDFDDDGEFDDATGINPTNTWTTPGIYSIELKVTDDEGDIDIDDTTIKIIRRVICIDIKPGSCPNSINIYAKGNIPVAILTTDVFDASTVDPMTVEFLGAFPCKPAQLEDVDFDGDIDMIFHFKTQQLDFSKVVNIGGSLYAQLTGETYTNIAFIGQDTVRLLYGNVLSGLLQSHLQQFSMFEKIINFLYDLFNQ